MSAGGRQGAVVVEVVVVVVGLLGEWERRGEISFRALRLPLPPTHAGHSD